MAYSLFPKKVSISKPMAIGLSSLNTVSIAIIVLFCSLFAIDTYSFWERILFCLSLWGFGYSVSPYLRRKKTFCVLFFLLLCCIDLIFCLELLSYVLMGSTFNRTFYAHLDINTVSDGLRIFPMLTIGIILTVIILMALVSLKVWVFYTRPGQLKGKWQKTILSICFIALIVLENPVYSLAAAYDGYGALFMKQKKKVLQRAVSRQAIHQSIPSWFEHPVSKEALQATAGKNLVMIYLESMETGYTDDELFPGLTPHIDQMLTQGLSFDTMEQGYISPAFTYSALFTTQTGYAIDPFTFGDTGERYKVVGLADILHAAGYYNVFMGGASPTFSQKGLFLETHGFDEVYGKERLNPRLEQPCKSFGLHDDQLFPFVNEKFDELAASKQPFNLTVLTLDTHWPNGFPSQSTPDFEGRYGEWSIVQAVYGTDFLLKQLVDHIKKSSVADNTLIFILGDHLVQRCKTVDILSKKKRKLLVFALGVDSPKVITKPGSHFDIPDIVLQLLGVKTNYRFPVRGYFSDSGTHSVQYLKDEQFIEAITVY